MEPLYNCRKIPHLDNVSGYLLLLFCYCCEAGSHVASVGCKLTIEPQLALSPDPHNSVSQGWAHSVSQHALLSSFLKKRMLKEENDPN